MHDKTKQRVLDAFLLVMRPIARILLRYGIGYREFAEVTKIALVDVSLSDFGLRGRPTNISRVAVMTGLTRKEVRRLRDKLDDGRRISVSQINSNLENSHRWHGENDFMDERGNPLCCTFREENYFHELVKRFGGDVPPGAMRTELKSVGSVRRRRGKLKLLRKIVPTDYTENLVTILVHAVYALLSTVST